MHTRPLTNTEFSLLAVGFVLAAIGFGAWLDRDVVDDSIEFEVSAAQISDAEIYEQGRLQGHEQGVRDSRARLMAVYNQGLEDGAAGVLTVMAGTRDLAAAQGCAAMGYRMKPAARGDRIDGGPVASAQVSQGVRP